MKTFVIYNRPIDRSYVNAIECKGSFLKYKGWDVELFDGCNPAIYDWVEDQPWKVKKEVKSGVGAIILERVEE